MEIYSTTGIFNLQKALVEDCHNISALVTYKTP